MLDAVVTVGTFDGVHRGHQMVLSALIDKAQELKLHSVVVTFDQQPNVAAKLGNVSPATVSIPLHDMGVKLAHMARNLIDGETVDTVTTLPCSLVEGESVASIEPT